MPLERLVKHSAQMGRRKSRLLGFIYWLVIGTSLAILAAWCFSVFGYVVYRASLESGRLHVYLGRGTVSFWHSPTSFQGLTGLSHYAYGWHPPGRIPVSRALGLRLPERISLPTYNGIAIPLWLLWAAISLPLGAVTVRKALSRRQASRQFKVGRLSTHVSLLVAAPTYLVSMVGLVWLLGEVAKFFDWYAPNGRVGTFTLAVIMFVALFVPYLVARYVHDKLRWRRVEGTNLCIECGYDLIENVSGRCPECGTVLEVGPMEAGRI